MSTPLFPLPSSSTAPWGWRGLLWDVEKTPEYHTEAQRTVSGREARQAYYASPLWHYTLTWECLEDLAIRTATPLVRNGSRSFPQTEFEQFVGFLLARKGQFDPFFFRDPTDRRVLGQAIGTTVAGVQDYQMVRTIGSGGYTFVEPVGGIDVTGFGGANVVNVATLGTPAYTANSPYDGWIHFTSDPGAGHAITADFSYFFKTRFSKDQVPLHTLLADFWEARKVELVTVRP